VYLHIRAYVHARTRASLNCIIPGMYWRDEEGRRRLREIESGRVNYRVEHFGTVSRVYASLLMPTWLRSKEASGG